MKKKFSVFLCLSLIFVIVGCGTKETEKKKTTTEEKTMKTSLTYIGHAAVKLTTKKGQVVYIDPAYAKGDYSEAADLILVTHAHSDHFMPSLMNKKKDGKLITWKEALINGQYQTFDVDGIHVEAVPAGNKNHDINQCVGYLITVDGKTIYHAGDTSMLDTMSRLKEKKIDYAMYPIDGQYNMDAKEATKVANLVGAANNIPIHEFDTGDVKKSDAFVPENRLVLEYGQTINLDSETE